ncbi:hypothetical protein EWM64_g5538 [Hericium alpestre]|uniref:DUF427 domain-containing protein n=1 Tax=Hericium alpestre TaxID=135208 RepID=A0A4Y9ZYA7_9AGAM|nr:hypothetical protein EWM64_g5538 [Hericium alpestre]
MSTTTRRVDEPHELPVDDIPRLYEDIDLPGPVPFRIYDISHFQHCLCIAYVAMQVADRDYLASSLLAMEILRPAECLAATLPVEVEGKGEYEGCSHQQTSHGHDGGLERVGDPDAVACKSVMHINEQLHLMSIIDVPNRLTNANMPSVPFPHAGYSESSPKRVRVLFGGHWIADTTQAKLVWEHAFYAHYYFPQSAVSDKYLKPSSSDSNSKTYDVVVGNRRAEAAAISFKDGDFKGLVKIVFGKMDAWFEEEEQIFVHPKDPYKRVDVLQSARHIRVEVDGVEVANTKKPLLLYETGLHVRTYLPKTDTRLDLLVPSELTTECPYKGVANYYNVNMPSGKKHENIVWWYRSPLPDCVDIKGYVAFYDEKVDVWVDGEKAKRP